MQAKYAPACCCFPAPLLMLALSAACPAQTSEPIDEQQGDDARLEQALAQRGSLYAVETPLSEVASHLSTEFQVPIVLSVRKLEEAGINSDVPVNNRLESVPLESILRAVLAELELDFTIRNHVILIT